MTLVVDVCMPPLLAKRLKEAGHDAVHWSEIGDPQASDSVILGRSRAQGFVIIIHDLDFGDLLAASGASGPSVIIVREQSTDPDDILSFLMRTLEQFEEEIAKGCLISVNSAFARTRPLPIR
ncbi:MAG: DUF5615 family PIN-like protein [Flavobacteriales bacterium]|nr:DUF5615 family PIN-like protein [Flavobacteriales bacterium]